MAKSHNSSSIFVSWDIPLRPNGQITQYSIKYSDNDQPVTTSNLNITIPNLKAGITYNITVQPITAYGNLHLMGAISIIIPVTLNTTTPNISKDDDNALTRCAHMKHIISCHYSNNLQWVTITSKCQHLHLINITQRGHWNVCLIKI